MKKGSYVDNHESKWAIQHEREFLREYKAVYDQGANFINDIDKDLCKDAAGWVVEELKHARSFGFGGQLKSDHTGPVVVIICDDEVCCHASERELYCWRFEGYTKGQTPVNTVGLYAHRERGPPEPI